MKRRAAILCLAVSALLTPAATLCASEAGYVYVAVPAVECALVSPCAPPKLVVVDGATALQVLTIDLPVHTVPKGMAISPDGRHLYVSNLAIEPGGQTSITVIDATRHVAIATYPLGTRQAGPLAVRGDDSRVFMLLDAVDPAVPASDPPSVATLAAFDTASHAVVQAVTLGLPATAVVVNSELDRVYVAGIDTTSNLSGTRITAYEPESLAETDRANISATARPVGLALSRDQRTVFAHTDQPTFLGPRGTSVSLLDAATLDVVTTLETQTFSPGDPVHSARTREVVMSESRISLDTRSRLALPEGPFSAVTIEPSEHRAFGIGQPARISNQFPLKAIDLDTNTVVGFVLMPPARRDERVLMVSTPQGAPSCTYRLDHRSVSFTRSGDASIPAGTGGAIVHLTTDCAWQAMPGSTSHVHLSPSSGIGSAAVTVTVEPNDAVVTHAEDTSVGGQLLTVTQAGLSTQGPFGFIDTPRDGASGLSGAIALTGWALDDVGVDRVEIFRDPAAGEPQVPIPVGTASFVDGVRPDVQAAFPSLPFASRAGWGHMLLTNMLPGGGNGTYRLYFYAHDIEGQRTFLGARTIAAANTTATVPFGTIDTPAQGEIVSGTIVNWGWALTPQPGVIPADGSTITVVVDNVPVGHPTYGLSRPDIVSLFPSFQNATTAVGFFILDTTTLTNGVHTLAWVVRDNMNRVQGIGSRFITVQNP